MQEIWKPIMGFENKYEVSNLGNVRSLDRKTFNKGSGKLTTLKGSLLKPQVNARSGYCTVNLYDDTGKRIAKSIHRLVATHFIDCRSAEQTEVNHINGNKLDNRLENLEWVTPKQNMEHALKTRLTNYGRRKILCIDDNISFESLKLCVDYISSKTGKQVGSSLISEVANGKRKSAYGYRFKYIDNE